jgi:hypothetical protein
MVVLISAGKDLDSAITVTFTMIGVTMSGKFMGSLQVDDFEALAF